MSDVDGKEQELFVKHIIRQFMKNQLKEDKQENNNSFVFLENSTLNMLITYLLMNEERRTYGEKNKDIDKPSEAKTLEKLEHIIANNKKEFEEIIALLKENI